MRKVKLLTLTIDVVQLIQDLSCAVEKWRAHDTERLDLSNAEKYECTCHVYGQTHQYEFKNLMDCARKGHARRRRARR